MTQFAKPSQQIWADLVVSPHKVELANKFTRTVAVGNPREFIQGEKEEQEIAESCNRPIKNAIICNFSLPTTGRPN